MAKEDFDLFWRSHLVTSPQGCHVPDGTLLYWSAAKEETSNFPWSRREGTFRSHPVTAVARDLLTQVRVATRKQVCAVSILTNRSPCAQCAEEVLKTVSLAKEKKIKLTISISFVALSGIRRPSWTWRGMRDLIYGVPVNESNENSHALRELQKAGVKLSTFDPDTWKFLHVFLGNGSVLEKIGTFLGGKYAHVESRLEEDRLMHSDFLQVTKGIFLTSPSLSLSHTALTIQWTRPVSSVDKVSEYRITCKKVSIKNKEDDEKVWAIQQVLDKVGIKITAVAELSSAEVTDLEPNTFYHVSVEAVVKGMVICVARKIYKTAAKVSIPSLQAPSPNTRTSKMAASPRPRSSADTSTNGLSGHSEQGVPPAPKVAMGLKRSNSTLSNAMRSSLSRDVANEVRAGTGLKRWNSLRGAGDRPLAAGASPGRKVSDTAAAGGGGGSGRTTPSRTNSTGSSTKSSARKISSSCGSSPADGAGDDTVFV